MAATPLSQRRTGFAKPAHSDEVSPKPLSAAANEEHRTKNTPKALPDLFLNH